MAGHLNILLVDDERLTLDLLTETLVDRGHRVTAVSDSPAAAAAVDTGAFDIAFLDNYLGAARGIDLMRELSARDPRIAFVLMTGNGHPELFAEAMQAGAVDCLSKPISEQELLHSIEFVLAARGDGSLESSRYCAARPGRTLVPAGVRGRDVDEVE